MDRLVREDIARYRQAFEAAVGVFGGSEPIQLLVKQFEGPLDATHAAAEVGLETADFLKEIRENRTLRKAGLLELMVKPVFNPESGESRYGTVKRDAWESQFAEIVSALPGRVKSEALGITKPTYKFRVEPKYPDAAKKARKEGTVILQMAIDENGLPKDIIALTSLEFGLEAAAIEALKKMTFNPATKAGKPISLDNVQIPYEFKLELTPSDPANAGMVLIPAGEFQMGSNEGDDTEKPIHTVYVDAFYIDKYEVTQAEYNKFLEANPQWGNPSTDNTYDNHPVTPVSWYAAMAYAQWVGKRLPTEAEWEKAARGGLVGQAYSWGNSIDSSKVFLNGWMGNSVPVGSYPPNNYGLYDMIGNVWEWCLDEFDPDFYSKSQRRNPIAGADNIDEIINNFTNIKTPRVLRGATSVYSKDIMRIFVRGSRSPNNAGKEGDESYTYGFRCVKDVKR